MNYKSHYERAMASILNVREAGLWLGQNVRAMLLAGIPTDPVSVEAVTGS